MQGGSIYGHIPAKQIDRKAQHVTATVDPPVITRQAAEVPFLAK
jgi:hypothetical protein